MSGREGSARRSRRAVVIAAGLAVFGAGGLGGYRYYRHHRPLPPPPPDACLAFAGGLGAARGPCGVLHLEDGATVDCGRCDGKVQCGGDSVANVCCYPTTCEIEGWNCGRIPDGCGGTLECGTCPAGQVCGGAGTPNVCGPAACTRKTCAELGLDCGRASDDCAGVIECGTCSDGLLCGGGGEPNKCGFAFGAPATELVRHCDEEDGAFTPARHATTRLGLWQGTKAVDFTLDDLDGHRVSLHELLATKPVLLELGSYSCPVFQRNWPGINELAQKFSAQLHVVTVYTVEAHPAAPDPSPFRGRPFPLDFSKDRQPKTVDERRACAGRLARVPGRIILVDELDNPVWCTYGPGANSAFLIGQDGTIEAAHSWLDRWTMERSIRALLAKKPS